MARGDTVGLIGDSGWSNGIYYSTPKFGGLSGNVSVAVGEGGGNKGPNWGANVLYFGGPFSVIAVYQQSSSQPVPTKLTVTLHQYTWRKSALDNHLNWFDPTPVARVEVPVVAK